MVIVLFLIVIFLISFFCVKSFPIFRIGDFPIPPKYIFLGHVPYLNKNEKILPYVHKTLIENSGFSQTHIGLKVFLNVSDKEFIKWILNSPTHITKSERYKFLKNWLGDGLILATGAHWRLHRKILTPAFHFKMIENHINTLGNTTKILIENLKKKKEANSVNIYPLIASFALDAVCESTMATSINSQGDEKSIFTQSVQTLCRIFFERSLSPLKMFDIIFQFYPDYEIFKESINNINTFTTSVIQKRRQELNRSVQNEEKDADNIYERKKTPFIDILLNTKSENDEILTDQDILDEVNTFIFAGYETTAAAISFTLYTLAQNSEVQKRAFEEQIKLFGYEKNTIPTYADLNNMKYLEMIIKETLRLYPPIPLIGRQFQEDAYYDGKLLPKGLSVHLSIYSLQRNPELFPEPDKFDPLRFENDKTATYSFVPFSAGQRNCIGQRFAMIEMKQAISAILRNFELFPVENHVLNIRAEASLKSSSGISIRLTERNY